MKPHLHLPKTRWAQIVTNELDLELQLSCNVTSSIKAASMRMRTVFWQWFGTTLFLLEFQSISGLQYITYWWMVKGVVCNHVQFNSYTNGSRIL